MSIRNIHLMGPAIFGAILWVISILASVATIKAIMGRTGAYISIFASVFFVVYAFVYFWPILRKNDRGTNLLHSIKFVGLEDIECREDRLTPLPPPQFFEDAENEIVITGISAYKIFFQQMNILEKRLELGKKIYVLLLDPESVDYKKFSDDEGKDKEEINAVLRRIKLHKLHGHPGFAIRFLEKLPTFTYLMIDGDLFPTGKHAQDKRGRIRIQPVSFHRTQQTRVVIQFRKNSSEGGAFNYFSDDLRHLWQLGKTKDDEFWESY